MSSAKVSPYSLCQSVLPREEKGGPRSLSIKYTDLNTYLTHGNDPIPFYLQIHSGNPSTFDHCG